MDRYTKVVLTVIAAALATIALQNAGVLPARAQDKEEIMKVRLCGAASDGELRCANLAQNAAGWVGLYTFANVTR